MEYTTITASRTVRKNLGNYEHEERTYSIGANLEGEEPLEAIARLNELLTQAVSGRGPQVTVVEPVKTPVSVVKNAIAEVKQTVEEVKQAVAEVKEHQPMTANEFLAAVAEHAKNGYGGFIMKTLTEFEAAKVSEVSESRRQDFLNAMNFKISQAKGN